METREGTNNHYQGWRGGITTYVAEVKKKSYLKKPCFQFYFSHVRLSMSSEKPCFANKPVGSENYFISLTVVKKKLFKLGHLDEIQKFLLVQISQSYKCLFWRQPLVLWHEADCFLHTSHFVTWTIKNTERRVLWVSLFINKVNISYCFIKAGSDVCVVGLFSRQVESTVSGGPGPRPAFTLASFTHCCFCTISASVNTEKRTNYAWALLWG